MNERLDVRVEVEEDAVLLVFPRKMDTFITPWQDAWRLGETLELAAGDVPNKIGDLDPLQVIRDQGQVEIGVDTKERNVCLFFAWNDRLRFSSMAAKLVAQAIRMKAQDLDYLRNKGVRLVSNKKKLLTKIVNDKAGYTQIIPGRR